MKTFRAIVRVARDIVRLTGLSFWRGFVSFYNSDNLTYAASVSYYSLLSLFPVLLLSLSVLGWVTSDVDDRAIVLNFILQYFPRQFDFITTQLDAVRNTKVSFGLAGTIGLVWGAVGFFGALSTAVNYAWGVEKQRSFWRHRLFSFVMLGFAGLILLTTLLLVSATQFVGASWAAVVVDRFPGLLVLRSLTIRYATTLLFIFVVGLIYYVVPNAKVRFRDVWIGALDHRAAVEGRPRGIFLVRARHVPLHAGERVDRRRRRLPGVGLHAGGDPAVRGPVHGRLCAAAPRPARGSAGRSFSASMTEVVSAFRPTVMPVRPSADTTSACSNQPVTKPGAARARG